MNNLVIIGNGFDLAHNLKTSYSHFIEYLIDSNLKSNKFEDMFTLGAEILNVDNLKDGINGDSQIFIQQNFKNKFLYLLISELSTNNWCDIENEYFKHLNSKTEDSVYYNNPKKLNEDFNQIKNYLAEYLKKEEIKTIAIESYRNMFRLLDDSQTTILNFNYTNTLKYLYSNEIKESKIIHIHGDLFNDHNPIIFGYSVDEVESKTLIDKGNEYMDNIKDSLYNYNDNKRSLIKRLDNMESINISLFGHSFGLSDKQILNEILNHKNIKSITNFYYEDNKEYYKIQINIHRIIGKENMNKLVDFKSSNRMPQHNDTNEQQEAFLDYFEPICESRKNKRLQAFHERLVQEAREKMKKQKK